MRWRQPRERTSTDRWAVSYADFLTLLLAVFVVLYASSALDSARFEELTEGVRQRFGASPTDRGLRAIPLDRRDARESGDREHLSRMGEELRRRVEPLLSRELPRDALETQLHARGLVVSLTGDLLFDPLGRPRSTAEPILREVAAVLKGHPGVVRIEAHTAGDAPASPRFEAAAQRSAALARVLVERHRVAASQLAAVAYAGPGGGERIDIVVLSAAARSAEPRGAEDAAVRTLLQQLAPPPEAP